jgi:hypothetical protein
MGTLQPVPETSYAPCGDLSLASQSHRALRTVLFTDMVASAQHAVAAGHVRRPDAGHPLRRGFAR